MQGVILDESVSVESSPTGTGSRTDAMVTVAAERNTSAPISPAAQMARDQSLAEWADRYQTCVLRWYSWPKPAVSLGYFQKLDQIDDSDLFSKLSTVRRSTGGGAIVHHYELTYSIAMPTNSFKGHLDGLYESVHQESVKFLRESGWAAEFVRDQKSAGTACECDPRALLCFDRRSDNDVVIGRSKILGSAQRRNGSAVLQHGSLLLSASPAAPHLLGLTDLPKTAGPPAPNQVHRNESDASKKIFSESELSEYKALLAGFRAAVAERIAIDFDVKWQVQQTATDDLLGWIQSNQVRIMEERFSNPAWHARR